MSAPHRRLRNDLRSLVAALAWLLMLTASSSQAGIFRDVMDKMGMSGPTPTKGANGAPLVFPREGFSCCVLHYDGDKINDRNYASLPMIPAGTPVEVVGYDGSRAKIKIDGKAMRLDHDYGKDQESLDVWVNKIVVNDDPRPQFAEYPPDVQEAIRLGKEAGVKRLLIFHHDPDHTDDVMEQIEDEARRAWANALIARDGMVIGL